MKIFYRILMIMGMMMTMNMANAQEQIEVVTRFSPASYMGRDIINATDALNKVQNKYQFRYSNIPGAGGEAAYALGLQKARSGTKILMVSSISDFTFGKIENGSKRNWDENDFVFAGGLFSFPAAIFVRPDSPFSSVEELVESIRNKKEAFVASNVNARTNIYLINQFKKHYKLDNLTLLKYGPIGDILVSVTRGEADFTVFSMPDMPSLKPLATVSDKRLEAYSNIPTTKEKNIEGMFIESTTFFSIYKSQGDFAKEVKGYVESVCADETKFGKRIACFNENNIRTSIDNEYKMIILSGE